MSRHRPRPIHRPGMFDRLAADTAAKQLPERRAQMNRMGYELRRFCVTSLMGRGVAI